MPTDLFAAVLVDEAWNLRDGIEQPLQSIFDGIFVALELLRVGPAHECICWGRSWITYMKLPVECDLIRISTPDYHTL